MTVNFINLTNGLEFFDKVDNPQFLRIRSTTLERKDYLFLLMDLDHNFLMNLALGNECFVYDCGANKDFSKTISLGLPFIKYALERRWLGIDKSPFILNKAGVVKMNNHSYFSKIYQYLFFHNQNQEKAKLKAKLDYYIKFLDTETLKITGVSVSTDKDNDNIYWKSKLKK